MYQCFKILTILIKNYDFYEGVVMELKSHKIYHIIYRMFNLLALTCLMIFLKKFFFSSKLKSKFSELNKRLLFWQ